MNKVIAGKAEIHRLCEQTLERCKPDQAEVLLILGESALTRFANNTIHQNVAERNLNLHLRLVTDGRVGMAVTNQTDSSTLDELIHQARLNARQSQPDPDFPGLPQAAAYQPVACFDEETAAYSGEQRASQIGLVSKLSAEKGLRSAGSFSTGQSLVVVANSNGVFAEHASTHADFQIVVMGEDSSGYAHSSAWRINELNVAALGEEAIQKAVMGAHPQSIEPGDFTIILDPYATQDLVSMLDWHGMGAQLILEGRSWMNGLIGQQVFSRDVNIWDDGLDLSGKPMPFDYEGTPRRRVDIIKDGVVLGPVHDRLSAKKMGSHSTGHALPPHLRQSSPMANHLFMAPGKSTLEELIRSTSYGLYITRFWYTRLVHPRQCVVTGMTRDGVFVVKDGEIAYPVKNLRFTQPYVEALRELAAIGSETRLLVSEYGNIAIRVPALKLNRFRFTGSTM